MIDKKIHELELRISSKGVAKTKKEIKSLKKDQEQLEKLQKRAARGYKKYDNVRARAPKTKKSDKRRGGVSGRPGQVPATLQQAQQAQAYRKNFEKSTGLKISGRRIPTQAQFAGPNTQLRKNYHRATMRSQRWSARWDNTKAFFSKFGGEWEKQKKPFSAATSKAAHGLNKLGRSTVRTIGELTMFTGILMMFTRTVTKLVGNLIKLGDSFAKAEKQFFVGAAFRERLNEKEVGVFDKSVKYRSELTGENKYQSSQALARLGSELRANGGSFNGGTLRDFNEAMVGAGAMTGIDNEKISATLLSVARTGKGSEKLGVGQLKLTNNINRNISMIATAVRGNSIGRTAIKKGTIGSSMQQIKSSFGNLFGNVIKGHSKQIREMFKRAGKVFTDVSNDPEVIYEWSRVITNLDKAMGSVFTKENVKAVALGASQWAAEAIALAEKFLKFAGYVAKNSDTVLNAIDWFVKIYLAWKSANIAVGIYQIFSGVWKIVMAGVNLYKGLKGVEVLAEGLSGGSLAFKLGNGIRGMIETGVGMGVSAAGTAAGAAAIGAGLGVALKWAQDKYRKFLRPKQIRGNTKAEQRDFVNENLRKARELRDTMKRNAPEMENAAYTIGLEANAKNIKHLEESLKKLDGGMIYDNNNGSWVKLEASMNANSEGIKNLKEDMRKKAESLDKNTEALNAQIEAIKREKKVKNDEVPTVWGNPNAKIISVLGDLTISPSVNTVMGDYGLQNTATAL